MSLSLSKKTSASGTTSKPQKGIGATLLPQVNLLPTDITDARDLKRLKVVLVAVVAIVLALAVAMYVVTLGTVSAAQGRLDDANRETARLQTEQRKYAEVPVVLKAYDDTSRALFDASYGEVLWTGILDALTAELPKDAELRRIVVEAWDPTQGLPDASDPVQRSTVARLSIELVSTTRPVAAEWLAGVEALPGLSNSRLVEVTAVGKPSDVKYTSVVTVTADAGALAARYVPEVLK